MNDKQKPSIRFKGFTEAWEQRKLEDIVGIYDGVHQTPNYQNSGVMFLSVENIATLKSSKFISEEDFKRDYKVFPQENDILMTRIGDVGTTNVVTDNGLKAYYVSLALLKYKSTDPYFLSNAIQSDYVQKELANRTLKTAIPMKINKDEIGKVSVMLPLSATEQQQIGTYFRNLDDLITLHQRKYDKLVNVKKSMLEKMFPRDGKNVPEIRFSGFTEAWEQRKLGELSSSFEYGLNAAAKEYDGENKYIRITDIDDESREFKQEDITSPDTDLSSAENYKLSEGDILFARTGASVGKSYIYKASDGLVYYAVFLIRARIKPEYNSEFVFQNTLTGDYEKFIKVTSMRSGQPGVNAQEYSQYQIMMPSKPEQDKISDCLRNLDNLITLHQREVEKLQNIKKSCLEKMFV